MLPDLVTLQEAGIDGYDAASWQALYAPVGTPAPILTRISEALGRVMASPITRGRFVEVGVEPFPDTSPATAVAYLQSEIDKWEPVLRNAAAVTP